MTDALVTGWGAHEAIDDSLLRRFVFNQAAVVRAMASTVRKMTNCLIAAVAIRNAAPVLHHDADFDVLARHTPLRVA